MKQVSGHITRIISHITSVNGIDAHYSVKWQFVSKLIWLWSRWNRSQVSRSKMKYEDVLPVLSLWIANVTLYLTPFSASGFKSASRSELKDAASGSVTTRLSVITENHRDTDWWRTWPSISSQFDWYTLHTPTPTPQQLSNIYLTFRT